ncbi:alpha/beta hydrolase [Parabacteroides pacaensis]|uniref:alpha/beta hydrolase n=1 Tax=Parabacteroides pacaensis TaxID=2086575 RepID=UPI000D0E436F|nr:alpha/beta hydrolase [Parabacteroides pacaensis]
MKNIIFILCLLVCTNVFGQYTIKKDISYVQKGETDAYRKERCQLDVYYPENKKGFATIIWFHGGGLEGGQKEIPMELKEQGFAIVAPNYRLSPKAKNPAYIEDAAEAVAWTIKHINEYGGDPSKVYVSGHSAGGYLTLIVGIDKTYLQKFGIEADQLAGLLPVSGQTNTHFTIRKERNLPFDIPVIDQYAPINRAHPGLPPIYLFTGDKNLEMTGRYEENAHLAAILKAVGNKNVTLYELHGFNHNTVVGPACYLIREIIHQAEKK